MMTNTESIQSEATISGISYRDLKKTIIEKALDFGFEYDEVEEDKKIQLKLLVSDISFSDKGTCVAVCIMARNLNSLVAMKEFVHKRLLDDVPEAAESLTWLDGQKEGDLPQNFRFANVISTTKLGLHFMRVRLQAQNLEDFSGDQIHFSLVLPKLGDCTPEWPVVDEKGRAIWPKGDKELHRALYTIRHVDVEAGWFEVDIFIHEGGKTTQWANHAQQGDVIGITGPSGRALPYAEKMLIAGDETAYPAIARLIDTLPSSSHGNVVLVGNGTIDYPMPTHDNFTVKHIDRASGGDKFAKSLQSKSLIDAETHIWMASENSEVRAMRKHMRDNISTGKEASYMAGFWIQQQI